MAAPRQNSVGRFGLRHRGGVLGRLLGAGLRTRILEFAWRVKNQVRPKGTFRLGGACHLMGTGMALPWALISQANLATGHIAEDMKLGVDLTIAGGAVVSIEPAGGPAPDLVIAARHECVAPDVRGECREAEPRERRGIAKIFQTQRRRRPYPRLPDFLVRLPFGRVSAVADRVG